MSRFSGWTSSAVAKLGIQKIDKKKVKKKPFRDYSGMIQTALNIIGIESVKEFQFIENRKYRFDLAIPEYKIAIEFEGIFFDGRKSRHTQAKGYSEDCKKYNLATQAGWKILRFTTADTQKLNWEFAAALEVQKLIQGLK